MAEKSAKLLIVGDTNLLAPRDPQTAFRGVRPILDDADAVLGQMEGMIVADADARGGQGQPAPLPFKPGWEQSAPEIAASYAQLFSAVACASNVAYPPVACEETRVHLGRAGLPCAGIGANIAEARSPAILQTAGGRVGLLSYTSVFMPAFLPATDTSPGCAVLAARTHYLPGRRALEMPGALPEIHTEPTENAFATLAADIADLRAKVDVVVLSCHWGVSGATIPEAYQRALAHAAANAGADLIFGHHPHEIQGAERLGAMPVFYSLGNFAFDNPRMIGRHREGLVVQVALSAGRISALTILPVARDAENEICLLDPLNGEGAEIMEAFAARSLALGQPIEVGSSGASFA